MFRTEDLRLATYNLASGEVTTVSEQPQDYGRGSWSQRAATVYFNQRVNGKFQLFEKNLLSGETLQLTDTGAYYPQETDAGKFVYYNKFDQAGLWRLNRESGLNTLVLAEFHLLNASNWQAFDSGIYYTRNAQAVRGFFFYDFESGQHRSVMSTAEILHFHMSADQSRVLISQKGELHGDLYYAKLGTAN